MVSSNNWYLKPLENMQTNLACISVDKPTTVLFVDQAGYVFDRIVFAEGTDLHFELERNGFTEARKDDVFLEAIGLPSDVVEKAVACRSAVYVFSHKVDYFGNSIGMQLTL